MCEQLGCVCESINVGYKTWRTMEKIRIKSENTRTCAMCEAPPKYCCPRCSIRTCSLACVNLHKVEYDCDGVRDKIAYIKLKNFTQRDLLSDYRLLEEAARMANNAIRNKEIKKRPLFLPPWLHKLRIQAKQRGTTLHILPPCFSRRKSNNTCYLHRERTIYWQVEWSFPQAGVSYIDSRISEEKTINAALDKYLYPQYSEPEIQQKLMYFQAAGHSGISVLMKKENVPANEERYEILSKKGSLKKNFKGKTIYEYPVLIVSLKEHVQCFPLD